MCAFTKVYVYSCSLLELAITICGAPTSPCSDLEESVTRILSPALKQGGIITPLSTMVYLANRRSNDDGC